MDSEMRSKILNNELCRLCLDGNGELKRLDEPTGSGFSSRELIERFRLIELDFEVALMTICTACIATLESFYKFQLFSENSQNEIRQVLLEPPKPESSFIADTGCGMGEEVVIEFLSVEDDIAAADESDFQEDPSDDFFECDSCPRTYKLKTNLARHLTRHHHKSPSKLICDFCGERFSSQVELDAHSSCVSSSSPECRFCNEVFPDILDLETHLKANHLVSSRHSCHICFKQFSSVSNRNSHLQSHNADNTFHCADCGQGFKSILYLRKHRKSIHTTVKNTCQICDKTFFTQQKFDYHMKSHSTSRKYKCELCEKSFMQHHHLENHIATHTGIKKFLCFICGREFRQDCNLKAHLKTHNASDEKNLKCPSCEKSFKLSSSLRAHMRTHDTKSQSQCPECGKKFLQRSSLRAHFQIHFRDQNTRPFKCTQEGCDKSFLRERSVKYHNSVAHGIGEPTASKRPTATHACELCDKSFTLQSLLKRHMLTHAETELKIRKHSCTRCEATFKRPEHLRLHTNSVHLKIKPHKCDFPGCEKAFTQVGDKNVHLKTHSDEKPHVCTICQKAFRLMKGLRAHEKIHANTRSNQAEHEIIAPQNTKVVDELQMMEAPE